MFTGSYWVSNEVTPQLTLSPESWLTLVDRLLTRLVKRQNRGRHDLGYMFLLGLTCKNHGQPDQQDGQDSTSNITYFHNQRPYII